VIGRASALVMAALAVGLAAGASAQDFRYPSTCHDTCMTVTAYYDYGGVRDWNCGSQTYGGHRGTDFAPYGSFTAMDDGRDIVAAAPGEVITAHDGEFDRCTTGSCSGGGGFGNYVAIRHDDGKVVYYAHMRQGSVAVGVGERVTCGQHLGQIGSSGYSTGPHLHFEPRVGGSSDDPFGGVSGCSGPESWWVEQRAYRSLPAQTCESTEPPPTDGATLGSVEPAAGSHFEAGTTFTVRITMQNTGTTTWTDGEDLLLTFDGGERLEAPEQVRLDGASVAPGSGHTFELTMRAPATPGEYGAFFRMDRYGTARFGDRAEVRIVADAPPEPPPDAGTPTTDAGVGGTDGGAPAADAGGAVLPDGGTAPAGSDGGGTGTGLRPVADDRAITGGCSATGGSPGPGWPWLLLVVPWIARRRAPLTGGPDGGCRPRATPRRGSAGPRPARRPARSVAP